MPVLLKLAVTLFLKAGVRMLEKFVSPESVDAFLLTAFEYLVPKIVNSTHNEMDNKLAIPAFEALGLDKELLESDS
jgi:hypothetical protein